jgi:hypothetical protein
MSIFAATQVLSFENFNALESHLRALKNKYTDMIKKYEETLGFILRDTKPNSKKTQKVQEKWALEMQKAMTTTAATASKDKKITKKEDAKPKMLGLGIGKDKKKEDEKLDNTGEWISIEPMSLFIGQKSRGLAEIYFETINILNDNLAKINAALSICGVIRAKTASSANTSLVVSFVNDVPTKVMLKPTNDSNSQKYRLAFSFAVPAMPSAARSIVVK